MRDQAELTPPSAAAGQPGDGNLRGRRFLLVTQPAGPFSRALAASLRDAGAVVLRVILNGGDLLDWGFAHAVFAFCPFEDWGPSIARIIGERAITDVVVFGDMTPYSATALTAARRAGVKTWVMENGYRRPNWVTVESDGVNANSALPRESGAYSDVDMRPLGEGPHRVGSITPFHVIHLFNYFAGVILAWPIFRGYRYPYALRIWPQAFGHLRRYLKWLRRRDEFDRQSAAVVDDGRPFFLACLQREGDSQLLHHSAIQTNRAFMARVIRCFAQHAPTEARLVVKNHPLDPGVEDLAATCAAFAEAHDLNGRVRFLEGGAFAPLAHAAEGIVAVNSTAALAALDFGTPVKLLGHALFDVDGLVDRQPLESFWSAPAPPDPDLLLRFRRRLSLRTQVWGSYHNPRVFRHTAQGVVARIVAPGAEFLA